MNILAIATLPPHPGGSAMSSALLLSGFAAAGHAVRVLSPITAEGRPAAERFAAEHPEMRIERFVVDCFETSPNLPAPDDYRRGERAAIRARLPAYIETERPDILFMGRETFVWDTPDIAAAFSLPCAARLAGCVALGILGRTLADSETALLLDQFRKVDLLISPAAHLARRMQPFAIGDIDVIGNPVDLQRFSPREPDQSLRQRWRVASEDVVAAHLSNMKWIKRPLDFILAAERALQEEPRLLFLIIGDGSATAHAQALCRDLGIEERFRFVGWVDHTDIPSYLSICDIVVMPSEDETQARVYLETQSAARVLLASDIPATREVVVDGDTGVLFRQGDIEDLAHKLVALARDGERRRRIGDKARTAVASHSAPVVAQQYLDALAKTVHRHGLTQDANKGL